MTVSIDPKTFYAPINYPIWTTPQLFIGLMKPGKRPWQHY